MIAFLPVARYRVEYQVASGRPFSSFERLLLSAINGGRGTLDSLADLFRLHRRMVIEGIVTLMQAGWVCVGQDGSSFVTTPAGRIAGQDSGELPATIVVSNRWTNLLLEKVAGQFTRGSDLDLHTKQKLEKLWSAGIPIPPSGISNMIEPGMITHLLPHDSGEWVRLVGPISVITDNRLYAIVDVDTESRKLTGVPQPWHALLVDELVDRVRRAEARMVRVQGTDQDKELRQLLSDSKFAEAGADWQTAWGSAPLSDRDLLVAPEEHRDNLRSALTSAHSYIIIVSSALSESAVEALLPDMRAALNRDVLVGIFWGEIPQGCEQDHARALAALKKLEYDSNHGQFQGRLVVNSSGLESPFNVLVVEEAAGPRVFFGSFQWLGAVASSQERHLSVNLGGRPAGARFCDFVADLASKEERVRMSSAFTSLRKAAARLRSTEAVSNPPTQDPTVMRAEANVFFDEAVKWYGGEVIDCAREFLFVAAGRVVMEETPHLAHQLRCAVRRNPGRVVVLFGGGSDQADQLGSLLSGGTELVVSSQPEIRANVVIGGSDSVIIGNRSWFSGDPIQCRPYGSAVALALRAPGVGDLFAARLGLSGSR